MPSSHSRQLSIAAVSGFAGSPGPGHDSLSGFNHRGLHHLAVECENALALLLVMVVSL
jgi:hypothetical protein